MIHIFQKEVETQPSGLIKCHLTSAVTILTELSCMEGVKLPAKVKVFSHSIQKRKQGHFNLFKKSCI